MNGILVARKFPGFDILFKYSVTTWLHSSRKTVGMENEEAPGDAPKACYLPRFWPQPTPCCICGFGSLMLVNIRELLGEFCEGGKGLHWFPQGVGGNPKTGLKSQIQASGHFLHSEAWGLSRYPLEVTCIESPHVCLNVPSTYCFLQISAKRLQRIIILANIV